MDKLEFDRHLEMTEPQLLLGFSGWMDGGEVSTGSISYLLRKFEAVPLAHIRPEGFYIYSFPGSMEFASLFRPSTKIEQGVVQAFDEPANEFFAAPARNLILFSGKEPNLAWREYADCVLGLCERMGVRRIVFLGSVAGLTPHTREPRFLCSVSDPRLLAMLKEHGLHASEYAGPASIVTYLTVRAAARGLEMMSAVGEIPAYVQGYNPRCIEAAVRVAGTLLGVHIPLDDLRSLGDEYERRLDELVQQQPELAEKIKKLEADYDEQVFDNEMGELKDWLQQQGLRVD